MLTKAKDKIEEMLKPYKGPRDPLKQSYDDLKQRLPSAREVARNHVRRVDRQLKRRGNLVLGKPEPHRIDRVIEAYTTEVDKRKLRGNQPGAAPIVDGYDMLQRIAEEIGKPRKHGRAEVFKE